MPRQTRNSGCRRGVFERLERRRLLAPIQGVVREDTRGMGRAETTDMGLAGITVFLDQDNDGQFDPNESFTITRNDDPATPIDETGYYRFDVPPGEYVVRQLLKRPGEGDAKPYYLQTAPLQQIEIGNPLGSQFARLENSFAPIRYTFEFSGVLNEFAQELWPARWNQITAGSEWNASFTFSFQPDAAFDTDPLTLGNQFHVIDQYQLRFRSHNELGGISETARVDSDRTSLVIVNNGQRLRAVVPLMAEANLWMVIETQLIPNASPGKLPRGGDISVPQSLQIVRGDELTGQTIAMSLIESHHWSSERAQRLGLIAQAVADEGRSFDFWNTRDDDGDGLPNAWEEPLGGIDINDDGLIDLNLASRGADPNHQDLFVEVDAMAGRAPISSPVNLRGMDGGEPTGTVLDEVIRSFAAAPVVNPDGTTGIRLHLDLDEIDLPIHSFTHADQPWHEFDEIADLHSGGSDRRSGDPNQAQTVLARKYVYRYALFADTRADGSSGLAEISGNSFFISLGDWQRTLDDGTRVGGGTAEQQAGTFMHELGHTLGLRHGGGDNLNYKPNYLSVMNYHWQVPNSNEGWTLDYSREELPTLIPNHLDETWGIGAAPRDAERALYVAPDALQRIGLSGAIDWNRDGDVLDRDVNSDFYRSFLHDRDGHGRAYDYYSRDDVAFDISLVGHNDWNFAPEDFYLPDDPEFGDGIHQCDNPEHSQEACYEDTTDFFTLSVSPDEFEPETEETPVILPFVDWLPPFEFDVLNGESSGVFSLHNLADYDAFLWRALPVPTGRLLAKLNYDPQVAHPPELLITNAAHQFVGRSSVFGGVQTMEIDLADLPASGDLHFLVKRQGIAVNKDELPELTVDPLEGLRYRLQVYAPRLEEMQGTHWDGTSPTQGQAGDGSNWNDARNWSVNEVPDVTANPSTAHVFPREAAPTTIVLTENVVVDSLQFAGSQTLCAEPCHHTLHVQTGVIDVYPEVTAIINANVTTTGVAVSKQGQGTLDIRGISPSVHVFDGRLVGPSQIEGDLWIDSHGVVDPTGVITVADEFTLQGTMEVDLGAASNDQIQATTIRFSPSSVILANATQRLAVANTEVHRTLIRGKVTLVATSDLETVSEIRGADRSVSQIVNHAGFGAFIRSSSYAQNQLDVTFFQAGAGDANGDGLFDSTDLVLALQGGTYESQLVATWLQGDWNGDGFFNSSDLIEALQQGTYRANEVPALPYVA